MLSFLKNECSVEYLDLSWHADEQINLNANVVSHSLLLSKYVSYNSNYIPFILGIPISLFACERLQILAFYIKNAPQNVFVLNNYLADISFP